ncbi:MAG TPA: DUF397 domain-containing protein [Streptosporangiaceae bacterium]|nr:DUF397 domain-containing protein [Streptosporangiaceae bacterium]
MSDIDADLTGAIWRKSRRSNSGGNCVEVASNIPGIVAVRDSKNPEGHVLTFNPRDWSAFLAGVQAGEYNL